MSHPNEQVLRDGFAALGAADMERLRGLIAPDAVYHVPGRSPVAGTYHGIEEILGLFAQLVERTQGTFTMDVHAVVGDDEHVFAAFRLTGQRDGKTLRDSAILVSHVGDGQIREVWLSFGDPYVEDEFWA